VTTFALVFVLVPVAVGVYAYVVYPGVLRLLAARPAAGGAASEHEWPLVTITVPAYNEERSIAATLDRLLEIDYPPERRHIVVISDASSDRTDEIVRGYAGKGVELVRLAERSGKTVAENEARAHLRGPIIVNTDASVRLDKRSLKPLIAAFRDPTVGIASGRDVSVARLGDDANVGEAGYVGYEMAVRDLETRAGGIVGASGCFYASRVDLHSEIVPSALSRDFAAPLIAKEQGYRAVSVTDAVCYVPRTGSLRREFRRKVRTMTRGLETLYYKRHLMNPVRYGRFAWMLISHKLVRWLLPPAFVVGGIGLVLLATRDARWAVLLGVGCVALVAAVVGWFWREGRPMPRVISLPSYFFWGVTAGLVAWSKALRGDLNPIWEPTRREATSSEPAGASRG